MRMHPLPDSALKKHVAVVGMTGAGKTVTVKGIVEHVLEQDPTARACIFDPTKSDYWGLTSSASGKRAGYRFQILGGPRGHVPLHEGTGQVIGELVATGALPLSIIDMADFGPGGLQRFFNDFVPALMRKMRGVLYLVLEEAHEFAPKERAGIGNENMTIYYAKKLATAGRSKGVRLIVASQRTQSLHNALLGSCGTVIAHQLSFHADQEPVEKWLKKKVDKDTFKTITESLANLATGHAWLCPGADAPAELVKFPMIRTFDNSATPDGAEDVDVTTAPVDRAHLREIMGEAVKEAEANDPATLKKRIRELEAELAKKPAATVDQDAIDRARQAGLMEGLRSGLDDAATKVRQQYGERIRTFVDSMEAASKALLAPMPHASGAPTPPPVSTSPESKPKAPLAVHTPAPPAASKTAGGSGAVAEGLSKPQQRILDALAWMRSVRIDRADKTQLAVFSDQSPTSGSYMGNLAALNRLGFIKYPSPGQVVATDILFVEK